MQRGDELPQALRVPSRCGEADVGRDLAVEERAHAPAPREPAVPARPIRTGAGIGIGSVRASSGSQRCSCSTRLAPSWRRGSRTTRSSPRRKIALSHPNASGVQRESGQIGVLLGEQGPDEIVGDVDLGGGHVLRRHGISPSKRARRSGSRRGTTRGSAAARRSRRPRSACRSAAASRAAGSASACAGCTRRA